MGKEGGRAIVREGGGEGEGERERRKRKKKKLPAPTEWPASGDRPRKWGRRREEEEERRKRKKKFFFLCFGYFEVYSLKTLRNFFEFIVIKVVKKLVGDKLGQKLIWQTNPMF